MTGMIEGNSEYNDSIIKRLHKVRGSTGVGILHFQSVHRLNLTLDICKGARTNFFMRITSVRIQIHI